MSGFSAQWLALREPVDHASIAVTVRARAIAHFAGRERLSIVDLGSGAGSSLRGLAPFLPPVQKWRLVDHDPDLLDHARRALSQWADETRETGAALQLTAAGKDICVEFCRADLAHCVPPAIFEGADLVSASAFFDLVASDWIERFADDVAARSLPLYALLTYDGRETWRPPHSADRAMLEAFHADQRRDKGFGPAAGPAAADALGNSLSARGFAVEAAASPWRLKETNAVLIAALAEGSAAAVRASGTVGESEIESWLGSRRSAQSCMIGHRDLFAWPPELDKAL